MRKKILIYGLISGVICITWPLVFMSMGADFSYEMSELLGYLTMILAFSMVVVAVKNVRDKELNGFITFGKALKVGILVTLVASTVYVVIWLIYYYGTGNKDCIEKAMAHYMEELQKSGTSPDKVAKEAKQMKEYAKMYENPFFNALFTYMEILPVGVLVSLISAAFLRRKPKAAGVE